MRGVPETPAKSPYGGGRTDKSGTYYGTGGIVLQVTQISVSESGSVARCDSELQMFVTRGTSAGRFGAP